MDEGVKLPDASALMKQGIALLNENTSTSLAEAVQFFDRALELRRASLQPQDHWMAYLTAASWMNRGDALTRLAEPALVEEAVRSYDEALVLMRGVPLEANPLYRRRLAIAWMNRGISLQQRGTSAGLAGAVESFERAIEVVREHSGHELLLACAWMNRGNVLLRTEPPRVAEARVSALSALRLLVNLEREELPAAEAALKARTILCQAIAELLTADPAAELVNAATETLEEGMELVRHWAARGETCFRPMLAEFFRFGVAVYWAHLPQFLAEFVLENLDPARSDASFSEDQEMHAVAAEGLAAVARNLQSDGFASVGTPRFDCVMETLRALQWIERRSEVPDRLGSDAL